MEIRNIVGFVAGVSVFYLIASFITNDLSWTTSLYDGEGTDEFERYFTLIFVAGFGAGGFALAKYG